MSLTVQPNPWHIPKIKLCQKLDLVQFSTSQISPFLLTYFLRLEQWIIEDISLRSITKIKDNRWLFLFVKTLLTSQRYLPCRHVCLPSLSYVSTSYMVIIMYQDIILHLLLYSFVYSFLSSYLPCLIDLVCLTWLDYLRWITWLTWVT